MSTSDPMVCAAHAGGMSDGELFHVLHELKTGENLDDLQQAVIDEAQFRGILSSSEASAITVGHE